MITNKLGSRILFKGNDSKILKNYLEEAIIWGNLLSKELNSENSIVEGYNKFKDRIIFKGLPAIDVDEGNEIEDSWQ